ITVSAGQAEPRQERVQPFLAPPTYSPSPVELVTDDVAVVRAKLETMVEQSREESPSEFKLTRHHHLVLSQGGCLLRLIIRRFHDANRSAASPPSHRSAIRYGNLPVGRNSGSNVRI